MVIRATSVIFFMSIIATCHLRRPRSAAAAGVASTLALALLLSLCCHQGTYCGADASFAADASGASDDALRAFTAWFHEKATVTAAAEVAPPFQIVFRRSPFGAGVFVRSLLSSRNVTVAKKQVVMRVRLDHSICDVCVSHRPYAAALRQEPVEANRVALALAAEVVLAAANLSHLAPWIHALPRLEPGSMFPAHAMSTSEMKLIEPKSARETARENRKQMEDSFDAVKRRGVIAALERSLDGFVLSAESLSGDEPQPEVKGNQKNHKKGQRIDWLLYYWTSTLVDTRAWNIEGKKYLIAGADMFNHEPDDEDRLRSFQTAPLGRSHKFLDTHRVVTTGTGGVVPHAEVRSDRRLTIAAQPLDSPATIDEGQLFESYGDNSDDIYFQYHGFVPSAPESTLLAGGKQPRLPSSREGLSNAYDCQNVPFIEWFIEKKAPKTAFANPPFWDAATMSMSSGATVPTTRQEWTRRAVIALQRLRTAASRAGYGASRGTMVCVHYGEVPPLFVAQALLTFLPSQLNLDDAAAKTQASCFSAALDAKAANSPYAWHDAVRRQLITCWLDSAAAAGHGANHHYDVLASIFEMLRLHVLAAFKLEFSTSNATATAARIAELQHSSVVSSSSTTTIVRLRFQAQRQAILGRLARDLKRQRRDWLARGAAKDVREQPPVRDAAEGERGSGAASSAGSSGHDDL